MKEIRLAQMHRFVELSTALPELHIEQVNAFLMNYNINDRSNIVNRRIVIDQALLHEALKLPTGELGVGDVRPPPNFDPGQYFKSGMDALDMKQGWRISDAITPDLMDWMRFVSKRLILGVHSTYLAQKYLYAVVQTLNGMVFN